MKRLISMLVGLCLTLCLCASALAATITITQQPESQTVKAGGSVSFSVKATNSAGAPVTWYFTNPANNQVVTGRKLESTIKGLKVSNPNGMTIILKKVPESMHGWNVYAHIGPKGGGVNTDTVTLTIAGMDGTDSTAVAASTPAPTPAPQESTDQEMVSEETIPEETVSEESSAQETEAQETEAQEGGEESEFSEEDETPVLTQSAGPVVIKGTGVDLYALDRRGKITGEAAQELTFEEGEANFYVALPEGTEGTIQYLMLDNLRLTPEGDVTGMSIRGWNSNATIQVRLKGEEDTANIISVAPTAEPQVDESSMVTVTCINCRFTGWNNSFAESGQVPSGSTIIVVASGGQLAQGYSINGSAGQYKDQASFQMVVEGDTKITMEKQK